MEAATVQTVIIGSLIITEIVLTWRIYRLERRMRDTVQHFVGAKNFLGNIAKILAKYRGVAETITTKGLTLKLRSEKLGAFELDIKPQHSGKRRRS